MNKAAQQLGRLAKGVPKNITNAERSRRRKAMRLVAEDYNAKRKAGLVIHPPRGPSRPKEVL